MDFRHAFLRQRRRIHQPSRRLLDSKLLHSRNYSSNVKCDSHKLPRSYKQRNWALVNWFPQILPPYEIPIKRSQRKLFKGEGKEFDCRNTVKIRATLWFILWDTHLKSKAIASNWPSLANLERSCFLDCWNQNKGLNWSWYSLGSWTS